MAMLVDKQEEVRDSSICDNSGLLGCSRAKLMAMLVVKQEEVRDSSICDNNGIHWLQSGRADGHACWWTNGKR